jgi:hypothetical protein
VTVSFVANLRTPAVMLVGVSLAASGSIAGCGGDGGDARAGSSPDRPANTSAATPTSTGSSSGEGASCSDAAGDGAPLDLLTVTLTRVGDRLAVKFVTKGSPPAADTALYAVAVSSASGEKTRQLGVKFADGRQVAYFVFDMGAGQQQNLPGEALRKGRVLTASFPASAVDPRKPDRETRAGP